MFGDWCEVHEAVLSEKKRLCKVSEKPAGRAVIRGELIERVRSHYDKLDQIADDINRLGFPKASAILKERMPQTTQARSGEMGEIIANEFFEFHTKFRIPVRRLRYKDGREMALRGDDFLGVSEDKKDRLLLLKGEAKSRQQLSNDVISGARKRLSADDGRPTAISLLFVADRLLEAANEVDQLLGRKIRDEVALKTMPARRITHGMFLLYGNSPEAILVTDLNGADGMHNHISVGFRVDGHLTFIARIFEEAGDLGNN